MDNYGDLPIHPYADTLRTLEDGSQMYSPDGGQTWVVDTPAYQNGDQYTRTTYDASGNVLQTQQLTADRMSAGQSALRAVGVLGVPALAMNAVPALAGSGGAPAAAGASAAPVASTGLEAGSGVAGAIDGMMTGSIPAGGVGSMAGGAGGQTIAFTEPAISAGSRLGGSAATAGGAAASMIPRLADGSVDWAKIATNPALWAAAAGAAAGIAGNGDITASNTTTGNTATTGSSSGSVTGNTTGTTNSSNTQSLAPWLQGYAQDYVSRARGLLDQGTTNPSIQTAGGLLNQYATQGSPLVNAAMQQQQDVINGKYLNANPYLGGVAKSITDRMSESYATGTRAGIAGNFNSSGNDPRFSSAFGQTVGNSDRAFGDSLGSTLLNLYAGNWQTERAAQNAAAQGSTGLANFGVNNAMNLGNFGTQQQLLPWQQMNMYGNSINPAFGSQSTGTANTAQNTAQNSWLTNAQNANTQQTSQQNISAPNNWMAGAGGAAAAAGLWKQLFGG